MKPGPLDTAPRLLTPAEVAVAFRVDPVTVSRWERAGLLHSIRTPGGTRRYSEAQVRELLAPRPEPHDRPR